ncbi:MAG: peptidoglycan-binding protein [Scytonema sp. PMC 1069.18]|nr:peptidoglycan-binding protein [Scytonema sp. PMC 1069.18]
MNWKAFSSTAVIRFLPVGLTLISFCLAEQALALKRGNTGQFVRNIQSCLKNLGYFNGPVNGNFASLTEQAVIQFQRANRLRPDGIVGSNTQQLLQSQCQSRNSRRSSANVSGMMRRGSSGSEVSQLQRNLQQLRYFNSGITGFFGSETEEAVMRFQQSVGILPDGVVGANTKEAIRTSLNPYQRPDTSVGGTSVYPLNVGSTGPQVTELQRDLQQLGFFQGPTSGYYGSITRDAVRSFQQTYRLIPNGIADSQTLAAITTVLTRSNQSSGYPDYSNSSNCSVNKGDICVGERSERVAIVQRRLQDLGFFRDNITNYYGDLTRDAVIQFQQSRGLPLTGTVDFQTWQALEGRNPGNPVGAKPNRENRYVVVVPISSNDTLSRVRQFIPNAFQADSRLGAYVNAGQFPNRNQAEDLSKYLRSQGLDARVEYF